MTAAALSPRIEYLENGVTLAHSVPFRFGNPAHIKAWRFYADGSNDELVYGVDYSVTGGQTDAGGTLTKVSAGVVGTRLRIRRVTPRAQELDYTTGDTFPAESHEAGLDKAMLIAQEQDVEALDIASRAILAEEGATAPLLYSADLEDGDIIEYRGGAFRRRVFEPLKYLATDALGKVIAIAGAINSVAAVAANIAINAGGTVQDWLNASSYNFANVALWAVPAGIERITIRDRGRLEMVRSISDPGVLWPAGYMKTQDASGQWWIADVETQELCAAHWGIVREPWGTFGGTDQGPKIQAWLSFLANVHCPGGSYNYCEAPFAGPLDGKPVSGTWKTTSIRGVMYLRGMTYVTDRYSIELDKIPNYFQWDGGIIHSALGEATFVNRRNLGGIAVGQAARAHIKILSSYGNLANAVKIVIDPVPSGVDGDGIDNSNLMQIDRIAGIANGCGFDDPTFRYTNTVSSLAQYPPSGSDLSLGQRTRINLGAFLPAWFTPAFNKYVGDLGVAGEAGVMRTDNLLVHVAGVGLRKVTHIEGTAAIWVYPKLPASVAGGAVLTFVGGYTYANEGSDSNVIQVDMIETAVSGGSRSMGCPYGSYTSILHSDGVGVADAYGSYTAGTCTEHTVGNFYTEAASFAEISNSSIYTRVNILGGVGGHPATGKLRVANLVDPVRHDTGKRARQYPALPGSQVRMNGKNYRDGKNVSEFLNNVTFYVGNDDENPETVRSNAGVLTINIEPSMETFADCIEGFGARAIQFVAMGVAAGSPPPDIEFPARAGWKYNGGTVGAALNWTGHTKMLLIHAWVNEETQDIIVSKMSFD